MRLVNDYIVDFDNVANSLVQCNKKIKSRYHTFSYKDIRLSKHSIIRAEERLNLRRKEDIKKAAKEAKVKGINWKSIRYDTYSDTFGLNYSDYVFLKMKFCPHKNNSVYFYKGNIFVFTGKSRNLLKTIISLDSIKKVYEEGGKIDELESDEVLAVWILKLNEIKEDWNAIQHYH